MVGLPQGSISNYLTRPIEYAAPMLEFHVRLVGRRDLSGEIYRQMRSAMRDGRMRPGDRLPPSRELSKRLKVARMTVTSAYERLVAEGYATSRVGAGTF